MPVAGQALQVVLGLAVVLALIGLTAWASRRLHGFKPHGRGRIRVLEALPLGTRERLLLVEVDDTRVLLGLSAGRIATLHAFSPGARPEFATALAAAGSREAAA